MNRSVPRRSPRRAAPRARQLVLEGIEPSPTDDSFPFRLDEETCRIGLENVARMRRILDGFRSADAA